MPQQRKWRRPTPIGVPNNSPDRDYLEMDQTGSLRTGPARPIRLRDSQRPEIFIEFSVAAWVRFIDALKEEGSIF